MGNTNFQTIHQMGTAISDIVKQATGRDNVQNVVMDHVTVAQNHRYEEVDISGRVVSFQAGEAGLPFEKLAVQINPVQDLHGYENPWPAGGGKNLFFSSGEVTFNGITYSTNSDGSIHAVGTAAAQSNFYVTQNNGLSLPVGTYTISITASDNSEVLYVFGGANNTSGIGYNEIKSTGTSSITVESSGGTTGYNVVRVPNGATIDADIYIQIESGSTATAWTPYSNICPITGWTMVNVYQSGYNMEDARVYRFTFPSEAGIVYGGTLDVLTGEMVVDSAGVDLGTLEWVAGSGNIHHYVTLPDALSINGAEAITSMYKNHGSLSAGWNSLKIYEFAILNKTFRVYDNTHLSARDFKTYISGQTLVYELATPITYHLAPQQITTLLGQNTIWSDTGDTEVKFTNVKELY